MTNAEFQAGARLAREFLGRLRGRLVRREKIFGTSDIDLAQAEERVRRDLRVPVDLATDAIRLGFCLASKYPDVESLVVSGDIATIELGSSDDLSDIADVLGSSLNDNRRFVRRNPRDDLNDSDRLLILTSPSSLGGSSLARVVSAASERGLTMLVVHPEGIGVPRLFGNASFGTKMQPFAGHMLPLLFDASLDSAADQPFEFPPDVALDVSDLIACVRRRRTVSDCVADLLAKLTPTAADEISAAPTRTPVKLLEDLSGYGAAKQWGLELRQDFELWRTGAIKWGEIDHSALVIYGPPGTGKTSFAHILADNLNIPLVETSVATWNAGDHLSGTLQKMQEAFAAAFEAAPCLLFIDELDGITDRAASGAEVRGYWVQIVNRFLELVSRARQTEGVILVGATNFIDRIDAAVLRSGRLDASIELVPPGAEELVGILDQYTRQEFQPSDLATIAELLVGYTGADIERLVRDARSIARRAGRTFSLSDVRQVIPDLQDGLSPSSKARLAVYRTGQRIAAETLGLTDLAPTHTTKDLTQIMSRFVNETSFPTRSELDSFLTVIMAGRAGERLAFGDASLLGAGTPTSDLALATTVAELIEFKSGLGLSGPVFMQGVTVSRGGSAAAAVRDHIDAALARASTLLTPYIPEIRLAGGLHGASAGPDQMRVN